MIKMQTRLITGGGVACAALLLGACQLTAAECPSWTDPEPLNNNADTDSGHDQYPQVTTDGVGNWVAVWGSLDSLGGTIGADYDILVSGSTDNGLTWTDAVPLNNNADTDSGGDYYPHVTTDRVGNWVAAWESRDSLSGSIGDDRDILVALSSDNGETWTDPEPLNNNAATNSGHDRYPQVTTDGAGNWVAVWQSDDELDGTIGDDQDILVARSSDAGLTWTDPVPLNTNAATDSGADRSPQVTTDGSGNWVAVWYSNDSLDGAIGGDYDILVVHSIDNGFTWTDPEPLNNAATDSWWDERPQITADGAGHWVAAWSSSVFAGHGADIRVAHSIDNGLNWTDPAPLNSNAPTHSESNQYPQVITDGAGNWVAVWQFDDRYGDIGGDRDILVARSSDNGLTWTDSEPLSTNAATDSGNDDYPRVTTDRAGNWVAVWQSEDDLDGTIGGDRDILVVRSGDKASPGPIRRRSTTPPPTWTRGATTTRR